MKTECSVIEINGRELEFKFEYNNLVDAEDQASVNLQDALERLLGAGSMTCRQLRGLIFAMIIPPAIGWPKEPMEQLKWCGDLVKIDSMQPLREALLEACTIAVSEEYHQKYLEVLKKAKAASEAAETEEEPEPAAEAELESAATPV